MTEKRRLLDLWLLDSNIIYRDVPFTVAADWLQQGRLLAEDKVRPAGGDQWRLISEVPALCVFLPRTEPLRAEDEAEALEPVEAEFAWTKGREVEDEEVDMIPLIDISLVLLIFFMMTAAVSSGVISPISTPPARYQLLALSKDMYWVGINSRGPNDQIEKGPDRQLAPWYSLGKDTTRILEPQLALDRVIATLERELAEVRGEVRVRLRADQVLPIEVVRHATVELQKIEGRINARRGSGTITLSVFGEVSEKTAH